MDGGFSVQGYFLMILWSLGLECLVALLSVFSHLLFSFFFLEIRELIKCFLSNYMLLKIFFPIVIMFNFFFIIVVNFFYRVGRDNLYFKKNSKRCRFSKKQKQKLTGCNRVFDRDFAGSTRRVILGHDFSYFFFNLARFQSRIDPSSQTEF
jgi:hypothetical protein